MGDRPFRCSCHGGERLPPAARPPPGSRWPGGDGRRPSLLRASGRPLRETGRWATPALGLIQQGSSDRPVCLSASSREGLSGDRDQWPPRFSFLLSFSSPALPSPVESGEGYRPAAEGQRLSFAPPPLPWRSALPAALCVTTEELPAPCLWPGLGGVAFSFLLPNHQSLRTECFSCFLHLDYDKQLSSPTFALTSVRVRVRVRC